MSFTRSRYDVCDYDRTNANNVTTLSYVMDPTRNERADKCRPDVGLIAGSTTSRVHGNLVDLESELRGITRIMSKCTTRNSPKPLSEGDVLTTDKTAPISTTKKHLTSCSPFINRQALPQQPAAYNGRTCGR